MKTQSPRPETEPSNGDGDSGTTDPPSDQRLSKEDRLLKQLSDSITKEEMTAAAAAADRRRMDYVETCLCRHMTFIYMLLIFLCASCYFSIIFSASTDNLARLNEHDVDIIRDKTVDLEEAIDEIRKMMSIECPVPLSMHLEPEQFFHSGEVSDVDRDGPS